MAELLPMRAVIYQDRGWWVAQCLEYDLCTSAKDRTELTRRLASQVRLQMVIDVAAGKRPFQDLPRAPDRRWEAYSLGKPEKVLKIRGFWLGIFTLMRLGRHRIQASISMATAQVMPPRVPRKIPPGAGEFDSGHTDTASRAEELLGELGFGRDLS